MVYMRKKYRYAKRLSLLSLGVIFMLCVAMLLQAPHVGTLINNRVASETFSDVVNKTSAQKESRADDFKLPTDWWSDSVASSFDGGTGTREDPYQIATSQQLALMANKINNEGGAYLTANYQLTADIDMRDRFWSPMGTWAGDKAFRGILDGGTIEIDADGKEKGVVHTISGLIMKNKESIDNGSTLGFFGVLGDQAVITNLIIDNSISYLDYELELDSDSLHVTMAIMAAQVKNDATILIENTAILNSAVFAPQTLSEDGEDGIDFIQVEVKAGVYIGYQLPGGDGVVYMNESHVRMSQVSINIYLDLSGWDMSPDVMINSFGGLIGEASIVDIQNSSFEGIVGVEVVRKDRNMDNAQFIYFAGGAVGNMYTPRGSHSYFTNLDLSGSIYLDTFKNENDGFNRNIASAQSSKTDRGTNGNTPGALPWSADVREIGTIIGDANMSSRGDTTYSGDIDITDVTASFFVDAPKASDVNLGDKPEAQSAQTDSTPKSKVFRDAATDENAISPELKQVIADSKAESEKNAQLTGQHEFKPHTNMTGKKSARGMGTDLTGPPQSSLVGPIIFAVAAPFIIAGISYAATLGMTTVYVSGAITFMVGASALVVALIVIAIIIIIAIIIFAVLFAFWGAMKPKWESIVSVGGAIGSEGRDGITLKNVHVANSAIATDTLFSKDEAKAKKIDSHNTTPTMGMFKTMPESPDAVTIGDKVHLEVTGQGTIMADGQPGVDSYLEYQWYYNTIDANYILDGTEPNMGGAKTVKVEGATDPYLDLTLDWYGSRFYFVKQINRVLEFQGNYDSVTARVGSKGTSLKPAEITKQPQGMSINTGTADKMLSVEAEATGQIDYQWYYNTEASVEGGTLLSGGTNSEFIPVQQSAGTYYYYVVVTVSIDIMGSEDTLRVDTISDFAEVNALAVANDIKIAVQPGASKTVEKNMNAIIGVQVDLSSANGDLSYQWFKADSADSDGVAMDGETRQSLAVDTSIDGSTSYYYVIAYNTVGDSVKSVRSETSKITVSKDEALKINVIQPEDVSGIKGVDHVLMLKVLVTGEEGGAIRYQWFKTSSPENYSGELLEGGTSPSYTATQDGYYYVMIYTIKPNGTRSQQQSNIIRAEFKDKTQYDFDQLNEKLNDLTITSPHLSQNGLASFQSSDNGAIDLNLNTDLSNTQSSSSDRSLNYQWYVSNNADGSDAMAIKGAVGTSWRVYKDSASGQKYYFVKITNNAQVYSSRLRQMTPIQNSKNLAPVAIQHPQSATGSDMMNTIIIVASVGIVLLVGFMCVAMISNKKKQLRKVAARSRSNGYNSYRNNNRR